MRNLTTWLVCLASAALLTPAPGTAQVGNTLPHSMGMGGNYTALARGFSAVLWNPAGLGRADNPRASLTFLPVSVTAGLGPVTPADLATYDGRLIPHNTRVQWLDRIRAEGGERGNMDTDLTYLAFSAGRVAFSASSSIRGRVNLGPDVAELLLFGNAGLTGEPRNYDLEHSSIDLAGTTTLAGSLGLPLRVRLGPLPDQHFAIGATVKYTVGHFLMMGQERGSVLSSDPVEVNVRFPMIHTDMDEDDVARSLNNGSGYGLDIGASWQGGPFSAGVAIRNIVNTFEWDRDALRYREGTALWSADTTHTQFEDQPFSAAPADLVARIDDFYTFAPVLAAGAAARLLPYLTVSGELRHALEENLDVGARTHVGVGGQLTIVPFLPLRAGVALVPGGYQLSGGAGLRLGGMQLGAAGALRESDLGSDAVATLGLTFGIR
jgi:hypothetical protein